MYSEFTRMAHGNNRNSQKERFRQRFMHKLVYYPENNEGIFISNLIQQLENTFPNIRYLKFESLNGYDNDVQSIENTAIDVTMLSKEDKLKFIPEYLNIELEDIIIDLLN